MSAVVEGVPFAEGTSWRFGQRLGDFAIGFIVFLGGFVIDEPAPYELLLAPLMVVWVVFGLKFNRHILPLIVLMLLYCAGGVLSLTQMKEPMNGVLYMAVTLFLAVSAIFFAAIIAEAPERRFTVIKNAYIAAAVLAGLLGILGYFGLIPGSDLFLRYGRVKGTFQDPNVFAPFLVLPIALLYRDMLTERLSRSLWKGGLLLILLLAIFLAFSRAAWGMTVFAIILVTIVTFITRERGRQRTRIVVFSSSGVLLAAALLAIALSIPSVSSLFEERAQLVESYDAGAHGRFGRQLRGFFLVQEHPLGIGPTVFATLQPFGEDEHNTWLKGFTTYGWLGGFAYIILAVWTLVAATPLVFKPRPWQPIFQCAYVVFVGHILIHNVIDNDHWRHVFLLYGMLWGAIATEKLHQRRQKRLAGMDALPTDAPLIAIPRAGR